MTEEQLMKIYQETIQPLYGYMARRTGGNRELTEDIVQESYLRALDSWKSGSPPDLPLAWLKRVARNILIDVLRHKIREDKSERDLDRCLGQPSAQDQFESLEFFLAISSLGRRKARVIEAFYYDGMKVSEIASEMSLSDRAVEGYLRRARQALKSLLPDLGVEGGQNV